MINNILAEVKIRTERPKIFVANFLSGVFTYQSKKPEQNATSGVATSATLNAPVLSTVSEIPRWSIHCYGPTMASLLYVFCMDLRTNSDYFTIQH